VPVRPFEWSDPTTLDEALVQLGPASLAKAGGVDLADRLKERLDHPSRIVNLRRVPGLDHLRERDGGLELGPMVTLARLAEDRAVRARFPALADAALRAATPNVRSAATLGGNLLQRPRCWYFRQEAFPCRRKGGDTCFAQEGRNQYHAVFENDVCAIVHPSDAAIALVAYGARVQLASRRGRRELPLEEIYVLPREDVTREHRLARDELLVAIHVPAPPVGARSSYVKQGERDSADWPLASAAALLEMAGRTCRRASVVLGAAAPIPWRARGAEAALAGKPVNADTTRAAAREALRGASPLAENGYKVPLLEAVVRRTLLAAAGVA
jgi:xanthine dehydrogenase YagS FAD-binding subunit